MQDYFETIKCDDEEIYNIHYHNKRVANTISKNIDLNEYIYAPNERLLKCKVIYNEDGIKEVTFQDYKKREISSFKLIYDDKISYPKKSVDRDEINTLFEKKEDTDEIIIIKNKLVTDTSIANIAIFDGTSWLTPKQPLLFGTTRARLLENRELIETDISVDMLLGSQKIAVLNAMIGMDIIKNPKYS